MKLEELQQAYEHTITMQEETIRELYRSLNQKDSEVIRIQVALEAMQMRCTRPCLFCNFKKACIGRKARDAKHR